MKPWTLNPVPPYTEIVDENGIAIVSVKSPEFGRNIIRAHQRSVKKLQAANDNLFKLKQRATAENVALKKKQLKELSNAVVKNA